MSESVSVYMVVNLSINDRDEEYNKDSPVCLEGEPPKQFDRAIIFSFPSEADADII
jgi:hypothetical protein